MTEPPVRAHLDEFGSRWRLVRAGESAAESLNPPDGKIGAAYLSEFFGLHLHPDDVTRFLLALEAQPGLTADDAFSLADDCAEVIYGLRLPALLYLWGRWPKRRHVVHGKLLAGGQPDGIASMDLYDVACLMWAEDEDLANATDLTRAPPERAESLSRMLTGDDSGPGTAESDLEEIRVAVGQDTNAAPRVRPTTNDGKSEVDELRSLVDRD